MFWKVSSNQQCYGSVIYGEESGFQVDIYIACLEQFSQGKALAGG